MTRLLQRHVIGSPYPEVHSVLGTLMDEWARGGATLELDSSLGEAAPLGNNVQIAVGPGEDPMHLDQAWHLAWSPERAGMIPEFDGSLSLRGEGGRSGTLLEIEGDYENSEGTTFPALDAVRGAKVASATARRLLQRIARQVEGRLAERERGAK